MNEMIVINRGYVLELQVCICKLEEALWEAAEILEGAGLDASNQRAALAKVKEVEVAIA